MRNRPRSVFLLVTMLCWAGVAPALMAGTQEVIRLGPPDAPRSEAPVETPLSRALMRPMDKGARGLINTFTGIFEVPVTIQTEGRRGWWRAPTVGVARGLVRALWRTGAGLVDVITFPAPPYEHQWIQPTYVFHEDTPAAWTWEQLLAEDSPASRTVR